MNNRTSSFIHSIFTVGGLLGLPAFLFTHAAHAFTNEIAQVTSEAETSVVRFEGENSLKRLAEFRASVRALAKTETLKLCEGYRRALGYGPSEYHGVYKYSLDESLAAWGRIFAEGLWAPLDDKTNEFKRLHGYGTRAEPGAINFVRNIFGAGDKGVENWFSSLYAMYLVDSLGFLDGAMHCLNTMDQRQIHYFAAAILTADREAALGSYTGQTLAGGVVAKALMKATAFAWSPAQRVLSLLRAKIPTRVFIITGSGAAALTAQKLYVLITEAEQKKQRARSAMDERLDAGRLERSDRAAGIYGRIRVIVMAEREASLKSSACGKCRALQLELNDHIRREVSRADLAAMEKDFSALSAAAELNAADDFYLAMLKVVLPVLRTYPIDSFANK